MNVTTLVFLGLAVLWAIVLLPEVIRKVSGSRRSSDSIRSFNRQLSVLDRSGRTAARSSARTASLGRSNVIDLRERQRPSMNAAASRQAPAGVAPSVRRRRQEVLTTLGVAALLTLLCTVAFGGPFLMLHLVCAGLLVGYIVLLSTAGKTAPARQVAPSMARYPQTPLAPVGNVRSEPLRRRVAN